MRLHSTILGVVLFVISSCAVSRQALRDEKSEDAQFSLVVLLEVNATQQSVDKAVNTCNGIKAYKTCQVERDEGHKLVLRFFYDRINASEKKQLAAELGNLKEARVVQMSEEFH